MEKKKLELLQMKKNFIHKNIDAMIIIIDFPKLYYTFSAS